MIELIVYPKGPYERLINPSPFCSKVECFLIANGLDYKLNEFNDNPGKFPKGKLPVIKHNGKLISDSTLILKYLTKEFNLNIDDHLSKEQKAQGYAISKMCEEWLYWSLLHERWFIEANWKKLVNEYFGHIPRLIRGLVIGMIQKQTKKSAIGHGMSRHSDEEVEIFGKEAIHAISVLLADKDYIMGDKISSFDFTIYAFVSSLLHSDLGPKLRAYAECFKNLSDYDQHMFNLIIKKS